MLAAHGLGNKAGHQPVGGLVGQGRDCGFQQRSTDIGALPRLLPAQQSQQYAFLQLVSRQDIDQGNRHPGGLPPRLARHEEVAGLGLKYYVESRPFYLLPKGGQVGVDETGVIASQRFIAHSQLQGILGSIITDHNISFFDQLVNFCLPFCCFQIDEAHLFSVIDATVVSGEFRLCGLVRQFPATGDIAAGSRVFHLDDFGAELGKKHADGRAGQNAGQFHHL